MNGKVKSIASKVAGYVALILLVATASVVLRPPAPLTATEKRLVGNWNKMHLPDDGDSSDMVFLADRTFHANHGQFVGTWWISTGQLHIKYHSDDWRENWSNWQPVSLWQFLKPDTVKLDIRFVDGWRRSSSGPMPTRTTWSQKTSSPHCSSKKPPRCDPEGLAGQVHSVVRPEVGEPAVLVVIVVPAVLMIADVAVPMAIVALVGRIVLLRRADLRDPEKYCHAFCRMSCS